MVRFSHTTKVQFIDSASEMDNEEKLNTWYTTSDYKRMTKERRRLLSDALSGRTFDRDCESLRGINLCKETTKRRRRSQENVIEAVIAEQEEQRILDMNDMKRIAAISLYHSKTAREEAFLRAFQDSMDASETLKNTTLKSRNIECTGNRGDVSPALALRSQIERQ
eukprot:CAMPEP_0183291032 /NCGR_PEP_ID=MMETSP0160_2-20130417/591_1 /TAXON_ID=2839 ORGANISM="Odontella Sinensis, Strain Grunow 1884" /NCGR_SAMPLE_ID=MMETSP0160_2 /ASSEMBLY_ACC=CAM_ASM_000250 /LENGTH=165 /DNA_ID=CAMNT_0025451779 /DNA_START=238 /DNA_END=735 /DNA_ORIENTATION=-